MTTNRLLLHQHPFAAFCWKPLIALRERSLPFEPVLVEGGSSRDDLARIWPMASMPVLRDETAGVMLPESSTIVEYLDRLEAPGGRLIPADDDAALQARLWDRIVDDFVARPMQAIVGDALRPEDDRDATAVGRARDTLGQAYGVLDAQLRDHEWLAGTAFTLADCAAAPALFYAWVVHPWDESESPELTRYTRALMARPSVRSVVDAARPYREVFPLPWPEHADAHQPEDI